MPMYDYRCQKCGYKFEELIFSWDSDKQIVCPECSSKEIEQLLSAPTAIGKTPAESSSSGCRATKGSRFT